MTEAPAPVSLRKLILNNTGQDVRRCRECAECNTHIWDASMATQMDIALDSMIQMILFNDDEVLTSRTIWSEPLLRAVVNACSQGINLAVVIMELRREAHRRGLNGQGCVS